LLADESRRDCKEGRIYSVCIMRFVSAPMKSIDAPVCFSKFFCRFMADFLSGCGHGSSRWRRNCMDSPMRRKSLSVSAPVWVKGINPIRRNGRVCSFANRTSGQIARLFTSRIEDVIQFHRIESRNRCCKDAGDDRVRIAVRHALVNL